MDLEEIRKKINQLDHQLVKILNQRMELTLQTARFKPPIQDKKREKKVLDNVGQMPERFISKEFIKKLFTDILAESSRLQSLGPKLLGFPGEHGANSEVAVRAYDSSLVPIPCMKFIDVFEGVNGGDFHYGLVPVENSLEGAVVGVDDLLMEYDLHICGEVKLHINHTLLTLPESDYKGINVVYSHPQAIAQCSKFINRHRLEAHPFYNTAGAAKMLSETRPRATAVIATKLCAEIYDLKIVNEDIENDASNFTRFILLSKEKGDQEGNKCSIIFTLKDQTGALYNVLKLFADAGINITRIESRPSTSSPANTAFLMDFSGSINDEEILETLVALEKKSIMYKLLGCYKKASFTSSG